MSATVGLINSVKAPIDQGVPGIVPDISGMVGSVSPAGAVAANTNTGGLSIVFSPGSVAVSFEGVVPSEADALRTGYAVGNGIMDAMARRDARLSVRVM